DYPEVKAEWIDKTLEEDMAHLLEIVVMGRACRNAAGLKNRQPLSRMLVKSSWELSDFYQTIIEEEQDIEKVECANDIVSSISYSCKPQVQPVRPKFGKLVGGIRAALPELDGNEAKAELRRTGSLKL